VSLSYGQTQQFTATATLSNGGTQNNPTVIWTSTGGSVSVSGLYTAGSTAGTFRVIATGSGFADTANVSISAPPPTGADNKYFNSAEAGCGTDPNVLLCDDFEDGDWYSMHCDLAGNAGRTDPAARADGWCGSIYALPITPSGAADCTGVIGAIGRCAATSGSLGGGAAGGRNMAEHALANDQEVQEVYIRWYYRPSVGFSWSSQKVLRINRCCNTGGIYWAGFGYNIGRGSASTSPPSIGVTNNRLDIDPAPPNTSIWNLNVSDYRPTGGRWSYYELHFKLNTPGQANGVLEFWANDCGPNAAGCAGTPTLRARHTNVDWGKTSSNGGIGSLWWENWANPTAVGTEWYDQIKVSKAPIGFSR
jgi:hypothetical protein